MSKEGKKKGSCLKTLLIIVLALAIIGGIGSTIGGDKDKAQNTTKKTAASTEKTEEQDKSTEPKEEQSATDNSKDDQVPKEYKSALNKAVGGSATSQHMTGQAADIDTGDRQQNKLLFEYISKNLPFDQLIDESNFAWVHVSYRSDGKNRKQVLKL